MTLARSTRRKDDRLELRLETANRRLLHEAAAATSMRDSRFLAPAPDTEGFDCGPEAQTSWLRRHALQANQSDAARVYVVCGAGTRLVVGYYALAAGSVAHDAGPPR